MSYKLYNKYGTRIHVYEFNPNEQRFAVEIGIKNKLERLHTIARPKSDEETACIINFNFFDWIGNSNNGYGEVEQNGIQLKPESKGFPSISFKDGKLVFGDLPNAQVGVGIGATLILDSKINIQSPSKVTTCKDASTAVGQLINNNIVFVVAEGNDEINKGTSSKELATFMLEIGCRVAFQGDRGGSSAMWCEGKYKYDQGRAIAGCLVAYSKKAPSYHTIQKGSKGEYVKLLQQKLLSLGYDLGKCGADGDFGTATLNSVIKFQMANKLEPDGIVGKNTWNLII